MAEPGEFELIARLFAPLAKGRPGALGLTDDVALIDCPPGRSLAITTDALVAGVHFRPEDPPDRIAQKAVRVNLSDLAAKGARPIGLLQAVAFPIGIGFAWIEAYANGLALDLDRFNVPLIGGDTVVTPGPFTVTITALGEIETGRALLRSGARKGDRIWVSGTLGDAALGLMVLKGGLAQLDADSRAHLVTRYQLPTPRLELGRALRGLANAAMDISDGLVGDLAHIGATSRLGAVIERDSLPLSSAARAALSADRRLIDQVLGGGDDYELLFTADPDAEPALKALSGRLGLPLTAIGRMVEGEGVRVVDAAGDPVAVTMTGYRHL